MSDFTHEPRKERLNIATRLFERLPPSAVTERNVDRVCNSIYKMADKLIEWSHKSTVPDEDLTTPKPKIVPPI